MADAQGIISQKQAANTPSIQTGTVAINRNVDRSSWSIQNVGTAALFVLMGVGASSTVYHVVLKGGSANDDGNGGIISQAEDVVFTGTVTVSGSPIRYVVYETS